MTTIYVGNLPFTATEDDVRDLFAAHGNVHSVKLIIDRDTGRPRGFGFVEMDGQDAAGAIEALGESSEAARGLVQLPPSAWYFRSLPALNARGPAPVMMPTQSSGSASNSFQTRSSS